MGDMIRNMSNKNNRSNFEKRLSLLLTTADKYDIMTSMIRNNNTNESNEMKFTKYNTNVNHLTTHEMVASKIENGLTNELQIICKIGKILQEMGKSPTQVNYLMSVDCDFITDVLSCYKG